MHDTDRETHENPCSNSHNKNKASETTTNNKKLEKFLPIANVGRIMKKSTPNNGKISKEAKEAVQKCVSEFISFITGEASDKCQKEKRKTVNGDDIIWALSVFDFENYAFLLRIYLNKYREMENEKLNIPKQPYLSTQDQHLTKNGMMLYCDQKLSPYTTFSPQVNFPMLEQSFPTPPLISLPQKHEIVEQTDSNSKTSSQVQFCFLLLDYYFFSNNFSFSFPLFY